MENKRFSVLLTLFVVSFTLLWSASAWTADFRVLILNGAADGANAEAPVLETLTEISGNNFSFEQIGINWQGGSHPVPDSIVLGDAIADGDVDFMQYDIIWFTWNGPGHDGDYFMEGAEEAMLDFVMAGGGVWVSAFDDNYTDAMGRQIGGWMPLDDHPASVLNTADSDVDLTPEGEASGLFSEPNNVNMNAMVLDDNYGNLGDGYIVLAERADNGEPAALRLPYGAGSYVAVCIDARSTFPAAEELLENGLDYFARLGVGINLAVKPTDKLAATWGKVKSQ